VNLGPLVNSAAFDFHPTLSSDATTLIFASERSGGLGGADLYVATREKLHGKKE
jgi:Tol biopolymer transport system component